MSITFSPDISIVLIVGEIRTRGADALTSILAQEEIERAEVILIDVALDRFPPLAGSDHPQVRTIQMGLELHMGELRAYGARIARSPIIAYLEEHALALPGWLKHMLAAFEQGDWAAVGGVLIPAHDRPSTGTLVAMLSFHQWHASAPSGEVNMLPGHDTAYRRDALLGLGAELDQLMLVEPLMQRRLRDRGYKLYLDNGMRWIHLNENRAESIFIDYFYWNIMFGRLRVQGRSPVMRGLRILTAPLIFPVRTLKSLRRIHGIVGNQWLGYMPLMPYLLLCHLAETLGLFLGYLGIGKDLARTLSAFELVAVREPAPQAYIKRIYTDRAHTERS